MNAPSYEFRPVTVIDESILRFVRFDLSEVRLDREDCYRLAMWDTLRRSRGAFSRCYLGYQLTAPDGSVLFAGEDYRPSALVAIDSDEAVRALLGFLTLAPGDTDDEHFANYTAAQLAFASGDAALLSEWAEEDEAGDPYLPLANLLRSHTLIGGYPIAYLTEVHEHMLCPRCAGEEPHGSVDGHVNWECPHFACDKCGAQIESAYGDPESEED